MLQKFYDIIRARLVRTRDWMRAHRPLIEAVSLVVVTAVAAKTYVVGAGFTGVGMIGVGGLGVGAAVGGVALVLGAIIGLAMFGLLMLRRTL